MHSCETTPSSIYSPLAAAHLRPWISHGSHVRKQPPTTTPPMTGTAGGAEREYVRPPQHSNIATMRTALPHNRARHSSQLNYSTTRTRDVLYAWLLLAGSQMAWPVAGAVGFCANLTVQPSAFSNGSAFLAVAMVRAFT